VGLKVRNKLDGGRLSMPFASQAAAKRFFVAKILAQATREGTPLSGDEEWMLSFSESDPAFIVDVPRVEALESTIPERQYESKIAGLVRRACESDVTAGSSTLDEYTAGLRTLEQGDHYLSIMVRQGLHRLGRPWWAFWR
jgi:hypothetical protein